MIFNQKWFGSVKDGGSDKEKFPVTVPGNIQKDFGEYKGWGDVNWMDNCEKYRETEDYTWSITSKLEYTKNEGERVFFVTKGIEYEYDIVLNSKKLTHHEGMFSTVEIDITEELDNGNDLEVVIYPHPKREGAKETQEQADHSAKPPVCYGWDWHPRLLVSGIWNDAYIETRGEYHINDAEVFYTLSNDLKSADVHFEINCKGETEITFFDMDGNVVYKGTNPDFTIDDVNLWWCNEQGTPYLYSYTVASKENTVKGTVGFKKIRLVINEGAWTREPGPTMTRSDTPITVELNNRRIFAKGSNWVNPEIFTGTVSSETYETEVRYAKECHMNLFRCWGGANVDKEPFFDFCDKYGIMVWQEFPLACNHYTGTPEYMKVLEQEALAIIKRVRRHACHIIWCGGNELFNGLGKMSDQSHPLRLLNKLCFENDYYKPFLQTSPLSGMAHGWYEFMFDKTGETVFEIFRKAQRTAYSEFGVAAISDYDRLKLIFSDDIIDKPTKENRPWVLHHGLEAWECDLSSWCCFEMLDKIFGKQETIKDYIEKSGILQTEGYRCIFEEARRQKPECSMVLNWCYNEPWITAAGNSIIGYPTYRKAAYYSIKEALKAVTPSARIMHFINKPGDTLDFEMWLLNDTTEKVSDTLCAYVTVDGKKEKVMEWETGLSEPDRNIKGPSVSYKLPETKDQLITVSIEGSTGVSEYRVLLKK